MQQSRGDTRNEQRGPRFFGRFRRLAIVGFEQLRQPLVGGAKRAGVTFEIRQGRTEIALNVLEDLVHGLTKIGGRVAADDRGQNRVGTFLHPNLQVADIQTGQRFAVFRI